MKRAIHNRSLVPSPGKSLYPPPEKNFCPIPNNNMEGPNELDSLIMDYRKTLSHIKKLRGKLYRLGVNPDEYVEQ